MRHELFLSQLRKVFDTKIHMRRDPLDDCMIVYDRSRSGMAYPVIKLAHEHCVPSTLGTPREGYDQDIRSMREMDWAEKYNGRAGAAKEIMEGAYAAPERQRKAAVDEAVHENTERNLKPWMEWRTGTRFHVGMGKSAGQSTGSRRAKDGIERARQKDRARGQGDRWN